MWNCDLQCTHTLGNVVSGRQKLPCPWKRCKLKNKVHLNSHSWIFVCLFGVFRPTGEFFTHLETSSGCKFDLCSALMAIEQWGFHNVPHPLWHGSTVYNDHLRRPMTITLNAERFYDLGLPHARRTLYLYATAAFSTLGHGTNWIPVYRNGNQERVYQKCNFNAGKMYE